MAATIVYNKLGGEVLILFTSNATVNVVGNTGSSDVAVTGSNEIVSSMTIKAVVPGTIAGNSAYWDLLRNTTRVGIYSAGPVVDYAQHGMTLSANSGATLVANLNNTAIGSLLVLGKKTSTYTST